MTRSAPRRDGSPELGLTPEVVASLEAILPRVGEDVVAAVIANVQAYQDAWSHGNMAQVIRTAVEVALAGFITVAAGGVEDISNATPEAVKGAFQLGRGEARSGRSPEALLAAYRVGARTAWRELSATAIEAGLPPEALVEFAALVFTWIDEMSAATVAGHNEEVASSGRARQRLLVRLGQHLIEGSTAEVVDEAVEQAEWTPPTTLTATLVPTPQVGSVVASLSPATLVLEGRSDLDGMTVLLVPDVEGHRRSALITVVEARGAVIGPAKPWREVEASFVRARRLHESGRLGDTERFLVPLVLESDPTALADLRAAVLAPLDEMRSGTREKLIETLRSWLRHQGRRDDVAGELFVHPQTVRYRMGQLREAYGDGLEDPDLLVALTVALAGTA